MEKQKLAELIFNCSHLTGSFVLRSGKISSEYFDKYQFESNPELLKEIAAELSKLIPTGIDFLAALEMGGIPIATAISLFTGIPVVFVRKKAKEYGTAKLAEGPEITGKNLLIVEDVITSGGQVVLSTQDLRNLGGIVNNAICVIDRQSGGKEALEKIGIKLSSLFTMSELKNRH